MAVTSASNKMLLSIRIIRTEIEIKKQICMKFQKKKKRSERSVGMSR